MRGDLPFPRDDAADLIPIPESFRTLGRMASADTTMDVPRHGELLRCAAEKAGVDIGTLTLHRPHVKLPPVPSAFAAVYAWR